MVLGEAEGQLADGEVVEAAAGEVEARDHVEPLRLKEYRNEGEDAPRAEVRFGEGEGRVGVGEESFEVGSQ